MSVVMKFNLDIQYVDVTSHSFGNFVDNKGEMVRVSNW